MYLAAATTRGIREQASSAGRQAGRQSRAIISFSHKFGNMQEKRMKKGREISERNDRLHYTTIYFSDYTIFSDWWEIAAIAGLTISPDFSCKLNLENWLGLSAESIRLYRTFHCCVAFPRQSSETEISCTRSKA